MVDVASSGNGSMGAAAQTLAQLNAQAEGVRTELARLRQDLVDAREQFDGNLAAQLVEANERLVIAALQADSIAETAVTNLGELARTAQRDALTDTPNRSLLLDRLNSAIGMARRRGNRLALLFIDLDHFKQINDTLGHAVGDEVLQMTARRLESAVRESDTVSRHSGDEFVVLLADVSHPSDAARIAAKALSALSEPSMVGGQELRLSASLGIAIFPDDAEDAPTLVSRADAAMYRSKKRGRGSFEFYGQLTSTDRGLELSAPGLPVQVPARHSSFPPSERATHLRDLREANEQLIIAAMGAQELEAQADEAHRRQIKFLAMVAHELRNPLAPIRTAAELLGRARNDDALLGRLQVVIKRQVGHMARLVEDLLDGSRLSTGKLRLEPGTVEMAEILSMAVETCRPAMDARRQHLKVDLPTGPLMLQGDPVRLSQVFSNLLDNASKYTAEDGRIALTVVVQALALEITVSDDGIGIPAEVMPRIFDLFVQDTQAMALNNRGLGIGLAVVRELVEAHGGHVVAHSAGKGLGSRFVVTLPLAGRADTARH